MKRKMSKIACRVVNPKLLYKEKLSKIRLLFGFSVQSLVLQETELIVYLIPPCAHSA